MTSETEVKLVEKIKFWEEQEKINGILVERILHVNDELMMLKAENEAINNELLTLKAENEVLNKELNKLSLKKTDNSRSKDRLTSFAAIVISFISIVIALFL